MNRLCGGVRSTRQNVELGPGLFLGVTGKVVYTGVRSVLRSKTVRFGFFIGTPDGCYICGNPVDLLVHGYEVRCHYRDTGVGVFGLGYNRLDSTRVCTATGLFIGSLGWGSFRYGDDGV